MTTGITAETSRAAADIAAAYAGNPSPSISPSEVIKLFQDLQSVMAGTYTGVAASEPAAQIAHQPSAEGNEAGKAGLVAITAPTKEGRKPRASKASSEAAADQAPKPSAMTSLIAASTVSAGLSGDFDPAVVWPNSTDDQRAKFLTLIKKHHISLDENGVPRPRIPPEDLVQGWEVHDPIDGKGFQMLKRRLRSAYDLDIVELRAMFHLDEDFPVTAPLYSESKRRQANSSGLGKGPKGKKKEAAAEAVTPITTAEAPRAPRAKKTARAA